MSLFDHEPGRIRRFATAIPVRTAFATPLLIVAMVASADSGHEHPHRVEEIVVTADPLGRIESHLAAPVSVLDRESLGRESMRSIGETVANQPGVNSSDFGASVGRPIIRGLGGARVRVLEDGIGSMDVSTLSPDHGVAVEPIFAEQIEIFRGPATLLYGSGASGGLVNVVTGRIPRTRPDAPTGELYGHYDTAARGWLGAFQGELPLGTHVVAHVDGMRRDTGTVRIPGFAAVSPDDEDRPGRLPNSSSEADSYAVGATALGERGYLGFSVSTLATDYGVPGAHHHHEEDAHDDDDDNHDHDHGHGAGGANAGTRIDLEQTRYDIDAGLDIGRFGIDRVRTRWGYADYTHDEVEASGEVGTRFNNEEIEGRVELIHRPLGAWDGVVGLQYGDRTFAAVGEEAFVPPAAQDNIAVFVFEKADFGRIHVDAGLRYESNRARDRVSGQRRSFDLLSLSGGASYEYRPGWSVAVSGTRAERAPSIEELFAGGPHLATNTFEIGDLTLGEETSHNIDLSWRKTAGRHRFELTFFYNHIDDFIYLAENDLDGDGLADRVEDDFLDTGLIADEDDALLLLDQRQRNARFWGFELAAATTVFDDRRGRLDLRAWSDFVEGELAGGAQVPRLPPLRFGLRGDWRRGPWFGGLEVVRAMGVHDTAVLETRTDGYTLVNVDAGYRWRLGETSAATLFARGTNLADQTARRHTSFVKDLAPLPGIGALIGARVSF